MRLKLLAAALLALVAAPAAAASFTLEQAKAYPWVSGLVAARAADTIAWVRQVHGVRNVWVARGPAFVPVQVTRYTDDDGQELTQLTLSPDGTRLVYVRGGDHDQNWPSKGDLPPQPTHATDEPKIELWAADVTGAAAPVKVGEGDAPALSARNRLAYVKGKKVWTADLDGKNAHALFFDRGEDRDLAWSPDGSRLAFVSARDDHSFVGVYADAAHPLTWLSPSTGFDGDPVWSPDGARVAFTRRPGDGGAPEPMLVDVPHPWAIWTADAATGAGARVWASPKTLHGSYPDTAGGANLYWAGNGALTFLANLDNWPHLYRVSAAGGAPTLLTPGPYMVEHVAATPDGAALYYSANTGPLPGDDDRRHIWRVSATGGVPVALTHGPTVNWTPVALSRGAAFIGANVSRPPLVEVVAADGTHGRTLVGQDAPEVFAGAKFVTPRAVTFRSADGLTIHGQLFEPRGPGRHPALVYVHGGPPRQMLLGWHYMDYYSHAYAMNQWLADHGYVVLAVNYRLGIGYGYDFKNPAHAGPAGSSEYQDVQAAARFLQARADVDPARLGIWGGSYGGLLTALALARDSATFKAGVDFHGLHDWNRALLEELPADRGRFERGDRAAFLATAWKASPVADVARWRSPVMFIHGDDDRNVRVNQTIDLERRLDALGTPYEELILPDEIHGFLREASWTKADAAMADFFRRTLGGEGDK